MILAWTERGVGVLGFRIERAVCTRSCSTFVEIGEVGPHVTAFRDGSVDLLAAYSYRIVAWNASGRSLPSNVVEVATQSAGTEWPADKE
ncbi:MAG: fibronectin type III domain-containing protein [Deltaproteobacteria bacterium]|nr:fibronectin type III domain-containing protein [Deltaproteobacteria bacterium]